MPDLTLDDGDTLHFRHLGSGEPLFLISGLSGEASFWIPHEAAFSKRYLVVMHDHRGTGGSGRRRLEYSIAQMAGDVLSLADHLQIERFHLVGHSTGGAIGQHLAVYHPQRIRSLVLSATWSGPDSYTQALFRLRHDVLSNMGMSAYKRIGELLQRTPQWFRDNMSEVETNASNSAPLDVDIVLRRIQALLRFDLRDRLCGITAPTLAIGAEDDVIIPSYCVRELAELIPDASLQLVANGGHFYPQVQPDAFRKAVLGFLQQL